MWFILILSIFVSAAQGSYETQFPIKELHYKVSTILKNVQELHLAPDPSEIALVERTKKVLEEYTQMDISSGLPDQANLADLKNKADDLKTSEKTRKAIMDGLEILKNVKELETDDEQISAIVAEELEKIENRTQVDINFDVDSQKKDQIWYLKKVFGGFQNCLEDTDKDFKRGRVSKTSATMFIGMSMMFNYHYDEFFKELVKIGIQPLSFNFLEAINEKLAEGKKRTGEIRKLKEELDFSQKVLSVKDEIKTMEELRDSQLIQKNLDLIEKLKTSFKSIIGSGLDSFEWRIDYLAQKLVPLQTYLKNLKIDPGRLTRPLEEIEYCIENYDLSMDFSNEDNEFAKAVKVIEEVRRLEDEYNEYWQLPNKYRHLEEFVDKLEKWKENDSNNYGKLMEILNELNRTEIEELDKMGKEEDFLPETLLKKIQSSLKTLDIAAIKTIFEEIQEKFAKINEFLHCYSDLKIEPSKLIELMDQPKEAWNFDARLMENAVAVVYEFKEAHRFLVDEAQKPTSPDGFPLKKEDVNGISDGLEILEAILNFQKFWIQKSDNFSYPLADELSQLNIHSNISNIQFPTDPQMDSIINFYSTEYQGGRKFKILKILESVKDPSSFPSKLVKMNEAISKLENWEKDQNPGAQSNEEILIDCMESTCGKPLTLPG